MSQQTYEDLLEQLSKFSRLEGVQQGGGAVMWNGAGRRADQALEIKAEISKMLNPDSVLW